LQIDDETAVTRLIVRDRPGRENARKRKGKAADGGDVPDNSIDVSRVGRVRPEALGIDVLRSADRDVTIDLAAESREGDVGLHSESWVLL
jgi:hypothetical protein